MSQMKAADLAVIKAMPGNDKCAECGLKQPQWASVSFGTVFCLECSGVHRSLGVHISFVRSIAMDSWTAPQLALMKAGGNMKCANYLTSNGIASSMSIQQKYDTGPAKLYKEVLKARAEGRPEPTSLPRPAPKKQYKPSPNSNGSNTNKVQDQNGMERLNNESEADYVKRQLRLREEAKARMAAKFGNSGNRTMGGVGSQPTSSGFDNGFSMDDVAGTLSTGMASATIGLNSAWNTARSSGVASSVTGAGLGLWSSMRSQASNMAEQLGGADGIISGGDGLQALNQKMKGQTNTSSRAYSGFGSDDMQLKTSGSKESHNDVAAAANEDPNSIAALTGETDKQYMERQIKIREEAKKRMDDKFGKTRNMGTASSLGVKSKEVNMTKMKTGTNDDFFSSFGA